MTGAHQRGKLSFSRNEYGDLSSLYISLFSLFMREAQ